MSQTTVEERVMALERTVAELVQSRRPAGRVAGGMASALGGHA